jgi:hypothetical protein
LKSLFHSKYYSAGGTTMLTKKLKALRRDAGLTQFGLARGSGIPRWKIANAELGIRKLLPTEVEAIRKALVDSAQKKSARVLGALDDAGRAERNTNTRLRSANQGVALDAKG